MSTTLKRAFLILALLLFASSANAGPLTWAKHHKRFLLMEGVAIGATMVEYKGLRRCQIVNGPEFCDQHYGAAWAMFGVKAGIVTILQPALAEVAWKQGWRKFGYAVGYSSSAAMATWGIHEWRIKPEQVRH